MIEHDGQTHPELERELRKNIGFVIGLAISAVLWGMLLLTVWFFIV